MIARLLLVVLVMLNLSAAAWWLFHRDRAVAPTPGGSAIPALQLAAAAPATPQPAALPADAVCASFGPFADAASAEQARQQLRAQAIRIDARQVAPSGAGAGQAVFWLDIAAASGFDPASTAKAVHAAHAERVACSATSG